MSPSLRRWARASTFHLEKPCCQRKGLGQSGPGAQHSPLGSGDRQRGPGDPDAGTRALPPARLLLTLISRLPRRPQAQAQSQVTEPAGWPLGSSGPLDVPLTGGASGARLGPGPGTTELCALPSQGLAPKPSGGIVAGSPTGTRPALLAPSGRPQAPSPRIPFAEAHGTPACTWCRPGKSPVAASPGRLYACTHFPVTCAQILLETPLRSHGSQAELETPDAAVLTPQLCPQCVQLGWNRVILTKI